MTPFPMRTRSGLWWNDRDGTGKAVLSVMSDVARRQVREHHIRVANRLVCTNFGA